MTDSASSCPANFAQTPARIQRVGVIGGGQLAWMMADAAKKLGIDLVIQTPAATDPAVAIAAQTILAPVADAQATAELSQLCDVITFENEFVDLPALHRLAAQGVCFRPGLNALEPILDKYHQRSFLKDLGLSVPVFAAVTADELLAQPPSQFPIVLKTRRHGYDGQGTFIIQNQLELETALPNLKTIPLLLEEFIPFERELAIMAARSLAGDIVTYPVVETEQQNQVCRWVIAPAEVSPSVQDQATAIARAILTHLQVVGIIGIELFLTRDGRVLVNEIAPRTHNSGHYSLDACTTSQFEQQLRAVCGLALGRPTMKAAGAVMVNLLGYESSLSDYSAQRRQLAALPRTQVHWYGKSESRPGRKLGHVTTLLNDQPSQTLQHQAIALIHQSESIWYNPVTWR
ncbi:MAG: 5-(carboxyamino)imidazole ribonucleotide synthase [Leptolyngbyaceae cyanobacterium bins.302]|nr:5-(carboxyamino)imidazole ribonucleotide synthase [Leptolyngbyaceae cyanobacterium bins.302]